MFAIETLRDWAGGILPGDDTQDATLLIVEAGVQALVARTTNRILVSPPKAFPQFFSPRAPRDGGLSGVGAESHQRIRLQEDPQLALTGKVTVTAGTTEVTGTGTKFTTQLSADPAGAITIAGETILVDSIASDTSLELAEPHTAGATDVVAGGGIISIETRSAATDDFQAQDPRDYELDGRQLWTTGRNFFPTVITTGSTFPPGRRTTRVTFLVGFEEDEGPPDLGLLVLQMFKSSYQRKKRQSKRVKVEGGFEVEWGTFQEEAGRFASAMANLTRPIGFDS